MCTANFLLAAIPLYMLMGGLGMDAGITRDFYGAIAKWFGHPRVG
jgi:TRAP-type C4-dicarboxylate transport system permease large subunit